MEQKKEKLGEDAGRKFNKANTEFAKTNKGEKAAQDAKRAVEESDAKRSRPL